MNTRCFARISQRRSSSRFSRNWRAHSVAEFPKLVQHAGEEFVYVAEGSVAINTDHYEPLLLKRGDSCYFDSNMGHALVSVGKTEAVVLWVCSR